MSSFFFFPYVTIHFYLLKIKIFFFFVGCLYLQKYKTVCYGTSHWEERKGIHASSYYPSPSPSEIHRLPLWIWVPLGKAWKWKSLSHAWLLETPWTTQSMEFSRPEYWSRWPFPSARDLPNPGIEPRSPALHAVSLPAEPQGKPKNTSVVSLSLLQGIFSYFYFALFLCSNNNVTFILLKLYLRI